MKTFDEAFAIIWQKIQTRDKVYEININEGVEFANNPDFRKLVTSLVKQIILEQVIVADDTIILPLLSARIHEVIQIGILIGIEMEKP